MVAYAKSFLGTPYIYAGMSKTGFDCSGFTTFIFDKYNFKIPHSSRLQAQEGQQVLRAKSRPGDLVIFTGTNPSVRRPGHVGIVISEPGDTIEFVHASSNGGVKISKVEGTRYDTRFLEVRRVL
ncbi:C40 family peptidase [Pontibacter rugosus]|uniref:C40 family peptidase n=2 Tax=Pontibacter rugosus TaxID=1745966 RepID=A0ABW3SW18_9BACT